MGIRKLKPTTPGQRHKVIGAFDKITASTPEKSLVVGKKSTGGRNNTGKMTMRYIGGGHKQKYRIIDFKRNKDGIPATVKSIEYDPNRSSRIALLYYADGAKSYIIAPNGLEVGQTVVSFVPSMVETAVADAPRLIFIISPMASSSISLKSLTPIFISFLYHQS